MKCCLLQLKVDNNTKPQPKCLLLTKYSRDYFKKVLTGTNEYTCPNNASMIKFSSVVLIVLSLFLF